MKALIKRSLADRDVALLDVADPSGIPDGKVLLEVKAAGVCGSDIHMWHNHHSWQIKLPLVLGHEFCGVVAAVGSEVNTFQVGERVVCETAASVCNECVYCLSGNYNLCPNRQGYGALADGAFTRHVIARPQILHRLPSHVPFEHAALTEPVCVAFNALVEKVTIRPGDNVVIQGAGPIGIFSMIVAQIQGAGNIIVLGTDLDQHRLKIASELGADYTLNIQQDDPVKLVQSIGDGFGADLVVDCTGVSVALEQALQMVRPNGTIAKIGWGPQPLGFNLDPLVAKAVTLQGSFSHTYSTWERAIRLIASGQINMDAIIGGVYALPEWEVGFSEMERGSNIKSVLVMD